MATLLKNLRTNRIAAGLSFTQLARLANCNEYLLSQIDGNGIALGTSTGPIFGGRECDPDLEGRLSSALGVPINSLRG